LKNISKHSFEEWQAGRAAMDKMDGILVDLRKLGFSLITGLFTAQGFLGYASTSADIRLSIIIATMGLVVILFWLDRYYYNLLLGAYIRTRFLEIFQLDVKLSLYMGSFSGKSSHTILIYIYFGFIMILAFLGWVVING
jgi:hypothetical protein